MIFRFGIRHHGPGSARSVERAFEIVRPDCVLIEGPPDANDVLGFVGDRDMRPPVALLVHAAADPAKAVFYPFAAFSPEWTALRWALRHGVPVRFIDLPVAFQFGPDDSEVGERRKDPLGALAKAAGYSDPDLFWERLVETADVSEPLAIFALIEDAMRAVRAVAGDIGVREAQREAHMRSRIREADKALFQRIAVVVGAWHAPALDLAGHTAKADAALLKGLTRIKTAVAWIPWTAARLAAESGYGAGVQAPGWYAHLYADAGQAAAERGHRSVATGWAVKAARLLRQAELGAGAASVVEVVRTADALATLRNLAAPGLEELREAVLAGMCAGQPARLELVRRELEIGDELGEVPHAAPATPLRRDIEAQLKHLRLKRAASAERHAWDLRKDLERERVVFLHRLALLGIAFGERLQESGTVGEGSFKEIWELRWDPSFEVELALAARWGNTLETAANAFATSRLPEAELATLGDTLAQALAAQLPALVAAVLAAIDARAATTHDVLQLGRTLPSLARCMRYSDVMGTPRATLAPVFDGLFARLVIGLPGAAAAVDAEGAERYAALLDDVTRALTLVGDDGQSASWLVLLKRLAYEGGAAPQSFLAGRALRLAVEGQVIAQDELARLTSLALGSAVAPSSAAAWIEGLVRGSAVLLEHQLELWAALDAWLGTLDETAFVAALPVLRRTFAEFSEAERRRMAALVGKHRVASARERLDSTRLALLRPVLAQIYREAT